jgi:hypothetical protein
MLEDGALKRLTQDIRRSGCRQPVWVAHIDGELTLLDGRNRLVSCGELGIMPPIRIYEGEDPVAFINSQNIRRRHLKPSVRASIAQELLPKIKAEAKTRMMSGKGDPEVTCSQGSKKRAPQARDVAAEAAGTSGSSVQRRDTIEAKGTPSLKALVNAGTVPAHLAAKAAVLPKAAQEKIVRQVAAGRKSRKEIKALIDAAKAPPGLTPPNPRKAKAPAGPTSNHDASAWDLTAAFIHVESGLRAEGMLDGTTYEFLVQDMSLRARKTGKPSVSGEVES